MNKKPNVKTPIRVAHITTIDLSLRVLLLNQLRSLQKAGYEVWGVSSPGPDVPEIKAAGVRYVPVNITRRAVTPLADIVSLYRLYRLMRSQRFTIVHTHTPKAGILGRIAARLARVPIVIHTHHGFIFHEGSPMLWRLLFSTVEKIAAMCADEMFSVNREDIEIAAKYGICKREKMLLLGSAGIGIDLTRFDLGLFTPAMLAAKRREFGIEDGTKVVGFVGRLVREKGLPELFAAARIVRERVPDICFLFIGPVDMAKPDSVTPEAAAPYGISDVSQFLGMREDLPELYGLMDVFVLPSHREGFPRSPMEASAMGVPCVVTDIRGSREAVEAGRSGLLVPVENPQALARAILDLLTNPQKAARMGQEGCRIALERFDEQQVFALVEGEYARLLAARGLSAPINNLTASKTDGI